MLAVKTLKIFRGLMAFLTAIPLKMDEEFLELSARFMFLFPLVGALIGFLAGVYSYFTNYVLSLLFSFLDSTFFSGSQNTFFVYLTKGLASIMTLAFLLVLTGLQHTDGLVDVGNALGIGKASVKERIEIAHAWIVTRTGALLALFVSLCTLLFIFLVKPEAIIQVLIVAEVSAKLAMVTCAWQGTSLQRGKGSIFIDSMKKRHSLYLISLAASLFMSAILLGLNGILAVTSGMAIGGLFIGISKRIFGGVTGDIFGATNEIARMIALFTLVW
jgi:adenosylcobinamide-GDP ribazoletransferase